MRANALPPPAPMHDHFRDITPVRLILREIENDLHAADDALRIFCNDHDALAARETRSHAMPIRIRFRTRHRRHERHGAAALDTIDQYIAQRPNLRLAQRGETADRKRCAHFLFSSSSFGMPKRPSRSCSFCRSTAPTIFTMVNSRGSLAMIASPFALLPSTER